MTTDLPKEERNRLLAKIHIAKKQLGLSDESYRGCLIELFGKSSAADLSSSELNTVLNGFKKLGFKTRLSPPSSHRSEKTPIDKIRALWINLHKAGKTEDGSETALNHFVKNTYGVERVEWLSRKQASWAIEALKHWLNREGKEMLPSPATIPPERDASH